MSRVRIGIGYMPTLAKSAPKRFDSPGASRRMKACLTGSEQSARPTTSHSARFSGGRLRMYSGNRSIFTRVWVPSVRSWPLLRPCIGAVVGRLRHQREDLRVDVVREHAVEFEMEERLVDRARGVDRLHHEIRQALDGLTAVAAGEGRGLVHRGNSTSAPEIRRQFAANCRAMQAGVRACATCLIYGRYSRNATVKAPRLTAPNPSSRLALSPPLARLILPGRPSICSSIRLIFHAPRSL